MAEETNLWGYVSQEEMGGNNNFGNWHWGVNFDVRLKNIEYHARTKKDDGTEVNPKIIISFKEKENDNDSAVKTLTIFEPDENKQIGYDKTELTKGTEEFEKSYAKQVKTASRALCDLAECFVNGIYLNNAITKTQQKYNSEKKKFGFAEYANLIIGVIKAQKDWQNKPLDLFMQWASKLSSKGNSYLEIPNANQGHYVCVHQEGEWEEEKIPFHHYRLYLKENGVKTQKLHPIMRGNFEYFWKNNAEKIEVAPEKKADDFISDIEGGKTESAATNVDDIWGSL